MDENEIFEWALRHAEVNEATGNTIVYIKPVRSCKICRGTGMVYEHHPYGSTYATEALFCDCVIGQIPEEYENAIVELTE